MHEQVNRPRVPGGGPSPIDHPRRLPVLIPLTCTVDGCSHRVTEHAFGAGQRYGYYQALCGHTVAAAAMISPDGPPCPSCFGLDVARRAGWVTARPAGRATRHRRSGTLRRLAAPLRRRVRGNA